MTRLRPTVLLSLLVALLVLLTAIPQPAPRSVAAQSEPQLTSIRTLGGRGLPTDLAWHSNGEQVAVSSGQSVWLYTAGLADIRPMQLAEVDDLQLFESVSAGHLAWSPDGTLLAGGSGYFVPSVRGRFAYVWEAATGEIVHTFERPPGRSLDAEAARQVAWSPDGSRLAGFSRTQFWVWDIETGEELVNQTHEFQLFDDFRWVAEDNTLRILDTRELQIVSWDAETGEFAGAVTIRNTDNLIFLDSPDGSRTAVVDSNNARIEVRDPDTRETLRRLELIVQQRFLPINGLWASDSRAFVAYIRTRQPRVIVWDTETGDEIFRRELDDNLSIEVIGLSPDNRTLLIGVLPGILETWDIESGEQQAFRWASVGSIAAIDWQPDGTQLVSASANDTVLRVWDVETGDPIRALSGHNGWTFAAAYSPDGTLIASGDGSSGLDRPSTLIVWDTDTGEQLFATPIQTDAEDFGFIEQLAWSPDGNLLAAARDSNTTGRTNLRVYDLAAQEQIFALDPERARFIPVVWTPDGQQLVGGVASLGIPLLLNDGTKTDNAIMRFDVRSGDLVQEIPTEETTVQLAWQPGGALIANAQSGRDNLISFLDGETGQTLFATDDQPERFTAMAWHPDGEWLAVGTFASLVDPLIQIWQVRDGQATLVTTLRGHISFGTGITGLVWSDDGRYLASAADDGKIVIWELAD